MSYGTPIPCPKECTDTKYRGIFLVKKGMASKAFENNLNTWNTKRLEKQIRKGTVQYFANR